MQQIDQAIWLGMACYSGKNIRTDIQAYQCYLSLHAVTICKL